MRKLAHARPKTLLGNPRVTWPDNPEIASSFFYKGFLCQGVKGKEIRHSALAGAFFVDVDVVVLAASRRKARQHHEEVRFSEKLER